MDDSEVNPMKTGLMFVPLGLVMSPGYPVSPQSRDHMAELRAELEVLTDHGTHAPTIAPDATCPPAFRWLLERLRQAVRWHQPSPT